MVPLAAFSSLARDSRGRFYATGFGAGQVLVFARDGTFTTSFGRLGSGPGEFRGGVRRVSVGAGDSVYVQDAFGNTHLFSAAFEFVRKLSLSLSPGAFEPMPGGGVLVSGFYSTPATEGLPFHLLSGDNVVRSFGPRRPGNMRMPSSWTALNVALPSVMVHGRYSVHSWGIDGRDLGVWKVTGVPWLPATPPEPLVVTRKLTGVTIGTISPSIFDDLPVATGVSLMGADTSGLIWMSAKIVSPGSGGQPTVSYLVEVIDPRTNQILLSAPAPARMQFFPGTMLAFSRSVSDEFLVFTVWEVKEIRFTNHEL
jgi:hypothetical protein